MKRLLVVDGNSIINRAFFGVRPLTTKSGKHTNAIFGMVNILTKQLDRLHPDYAAVAFDLHEPTFRHKMYKEYKAGRRPTPPELLEQFPDAKEILSMMGFYVMERAGYEADDLQGTVAQFAKSTDGLESYVFSGDRDLLQLIDKNITVLLATNTDTVPMHRDEFFSKYGIEPGQFIDMKALMGDSSDNIPGVAGIGEKTAATLISAFGSLDGIYAAIDDPKIKPAVREKLLRDKENAYLSKELAAIDTNVPTGIALEDLAYHGFDRAGLYRKFSELELTSFITRFGLRAGSAPSADAGGKVSGAEKNAEKPGENAAKDTRIPANTSAKIAENISHGDALPVSSTLLKPITATELLKKVTKRFALMQSAGGFAFAFDGEEDVFFTEDAPVKFAALFDGEREIVCYDAKKLWHFLDKNGVKVGGRVKFLDLMLYAYVLNPGSGNSGLAPLISTFLHEVTDVDDPCADKLLKLEPVLRKKIREDGEEKVLDELELPLIPILAEVEKTGFRISVAHMKEFGDALGELAKELAGRICFQAGGEFNINSPKQLGEVLFERLGLPVKKKKSKSGYSTDAETLEDLRPYSPIIDDILEYRQVTKLRSTYAVALVDVADENARVHTDFKQALTATGRLSSADPNLQNIPVRTKMGRELRRCFIAEDGYVLVDADYSQIELRLLAHISGDYHMIETFKNREDIHRMTAAAVFGIPEDEVTEEQRKRAKAVNFGIVYGISGFSLAKDIGTSVPEATKYIRSYMMNYPSVEIYLEQVVEQAKKDGYTTTPMGRRRYIPELSASNGMLRQFGKRVAMNAPIQGAAADIMKLAMIRVHDALKNKGLDARIVMQVHDELVIETNENIVTQVKKIVKEEMENAVTLSLPLTVDVTSGKNWLEQE